MSNTASATAVNHVVAGQIVEGSTQEYRLPEVGIDIVTPGIDLDAVVLPRSEPFPAANVPVAEIVDLLAETGRRLVLGKNPWLDRAVEAMAAVNPLDRHVIDTCYRHMSAFFDRSALEFEIQQALGGTDVLDGWRTVKEPGGRAVHVRAFPARTVHVMAGNGPEVAALSITRGALTKGVNLLKLPSNDLFTATAILQTMAEIDPTHPTVRSFSAVYWRGGDRAVEHILYRPQFFDKIVVWGGERAVKNVVQYLGPGFEMVAFDPKVSVSMIGSEAFASQATLEEVAGAAAIDSTVLDQEGCVASRYHFVEGATPTVDRYCEVLASYLPRDREFSSAVAASPPPSEVREEVAVMRLAAPEYGVWGSDDGSGLVIRSSEPVKFHPSNKTVNVIPVPALSDAVRYVSPATQTVGVFPAHRGTELRDKVASAGAQRIVPLGGAMSIGNGLPHDGMVPLARLVRWIGHEGELA